MTTSWYFTPWSWITLALSGRGGYAHSFSSTHPIPVDQRFYLGGRTSIRGFKEDDIGSDTKNRQIFETFLVNYKAECQFHVFSDFGVALFFDGGNVFFDNPVSNSRFRHSVGPGLRYATPIGPMNLDFGFILARNKGAGEPAGRLHFSIGLF
ncbi:MAG: BamA/TamA family outer membrane protein [Deltaproteobacteria bacterium]|nr:BamA/TamA family outer membrane protein [Deltaproteobacteria bacterium]